MTSGVFSQTLLGDDGVLTYSGVVKRWECDRNDHWNVQFYVRSFQMASEVLATAMQGTNPGASSATMRHYRFHSELLCAEAMQVRSTRIAEGPLAGAVLHRMLAGATRRLAATAIEIPAYPTGGLPPASTAMLERALPRGLKAEPHDWVEQVAGADGHPLPRAVVGVVRPADVDHTGEVQANALASLCSGASHNFLDAIGLSAAWINETNCNRMAVEMSATRHGPCRAGDHLDVVSWISEVGARHFTTRHQVLNAVTGAPCATLEQLLLVIDLGQRKPVGIPGFIHAAQETQSLGAPA